MDWHGGGYGPSGHPPACQYHQHAQGVTGQPTFPERSNFYTRSKHTIPHIYRKTHDGRARGGGLGWGVYVPPGRAQRPTRQVGLSSGAARSRPQQPTRTTIVTS